jgi:hypothetical protein
MDDDKSLERALLQAKLQFLRDAWAVGLASGEPKPLSIEQIKLRGRQKLKERQLDE